MDLISFEFLLFTCLLMLVYFLVPANKQWMVLLAANIVFFVQGGWWHAVFAGIICACSYICALVVENTGVKYKELRKQECYTKEEKAKSKALCIKEQKKIMLLCFIVSLGMWIVCKYFTVSVFPLGISFYTFVALGYCIDVYRGKYKAEKSLAKYALFMTFFPQIIQGPFSRYNQLSETLYTGYKFSWERCKQGLFRILWGIIKKTVIADRFGVVADAIYGETLPQEGIFVVILMLSVTLRLYADFSGYMDIVAGICQILGIRLQENFRQPFFAKSIEDFWHRWHITLGAWFRDYLFYPVSMSKTMQNIGRKCRQKFGASFGRMLPSYVALFVVWTSTGLWHGSAWYYIIWGWMNFAVIASGLALAPLYAKVKSLLHIRGESKGYQIFQMMRTFVVFSYMEMFSSSTSTRQALRLTAGLFHGWGAAQEEVVSAIGFQGHDIVVMIVGVLLMFVLDILKERKTNLEVWINKMPMMVRYVGFVGMLYTVWILGNIGTDTAKGFMYAQF